jgi:hypothetical protein
MFGKNLLELKGPETLNGPVRITGHFYDESGASLFAIDENRWMGPIENWDIEIVGPRITIRRGPGDIALAIFTEPR